MRLADRLRRALALLPKNPLLCGDLVEALDAPAIPAAVLIAVTDRPGAGVILTVRRETMRVHAGQVAFPGGRLDAGEQAVEAALREAHEELALDPSAVEVVGALDDYRTGTGYCVTPVLGVIPPDLNLQPHDLEVADWFEAPLDHLLDPAHQKQESAMYRGAMRQYYSIDWDGRRIWGATAAMLVNLSRRLGQI